MAAGRLTASRVGQTTSSNDRPRSPNATSQTWLFLASVSGRVKGLARAAFSTASRTWPRSEP